MAGLTVVGGDETAERLSDVLLAFVGEARMEAAAAPGENAQWANEVALAARILAGLVGRLEPGERHSPEDGSGLYPLIRNLPAADAELDVRRHALMMAARDAVKVPGALTASDYDSMVLALSGIEFVRRAAELTAAEWERRKGQKQRKASAEKKLIQGICGVYHHTFGRAAGISRDADKTAARPGGPAIRFCRKALALLLSRTAEVIQPSARDADWMARCRYLQSAEGAEALAHLIRGAN